MSRLDPVNSSHNIALVKQLAYNTYPDNKVLAELTVVQAILESGLEKKPSRLALEFNNLFGVKDIDNKRFINMVTKEFYDGMEHKVVQKFEHYASLEDCLEARKKLFERPRYARVLQAKSFEEAAITVRLCGYATDPSYSKLLMSVYKRHFK